jgi:hypothetical protein
VPGNPNDRALPSTDAFHLLPPLNAASLTAVAGLSGDRREQGGLEATPGASGHDEVCEGVRMGGRICMRACMCACVHA